MHLQTPLKLRILRLFAQQRSLLLLLVLLASSILELLASSTSMSTVQFVLAFAAPLKFL